MEPFWTAFNKDWVSFFKCPLSNHIYVSSLGFFTLLQGGAEKFTTWPTSQNHYFNIPMSEYWFLEVGLAENFSAPYRIIVYLFSSSLHSFHANFFLSNVISTQEESVILHEKFLNEIIIIYLGTWDIGHERVWSCICSWLRFGSAIFVG